jgi:hypothetical protein
MPTLLHRPTIAIAAAILATSTAVQAQGPRAHTRPTPNRSTGVTDSQASELTLTLTAVAVRPIQIWLRTVGTIDAGGKTITATVPSSGAGRVKVGQRVRAFPPESRSSMYQAFVSAVRAEGDRTRVVVNLSNPAREGSVRYLLEIVTDDGDRLSVPNEALIERGGTRIVYVQEEAGRYTPREVETGVQGELYTEVRKGLDAGQQVVTFGSFFIDAEHKLKGAS